MPVSNFLAIRFSYRCPCCAFKGLGWPAYEKLWTNVIPRGYSPPYLNCFGFPSYEICPCCGFEFGFDDDPGTGLTGQSFEEYLAEWLASGGKWFDQSKKPANWSLDQQMDGAMIVFQRQ